MHAAHFPLLLDSFSLSFLRPWFHVSLAAKGNTRVEWRVKILKLADSMEREFLLITVR